MAQTNGHYAYYPGCSLQSNARSYDQSAKAVANLLNLRFEEVDDWNCCGATEYFSLQKLPAYSLVARNLAKAAQQNTSEMVAPCSACYLNLRKTDAHMASTPRLNQQINQALAAGGLHYDPGKLRIRHLLDVIVEDVGYEAVAAQVKQPLKGLRVAPYYGCLIVRPYSDKNPEYPTHMDTLLETLGATVVDFPMKAHCCGGHMTQISEETALELIRRILQNADKYHADMIVTVCPMCQLNLDAYQGGVNRLFGTAFDLPVLYFTQVMGLAFGLDAKQLGIGSEIVSAARALSKIGQEEPPARTPPQRRDKDALPMPSVK
ncbi:MAG: CoB--CoM heterodisulfide reductase iron-sulfur subunit B family protein [Anaerolineae bacterium]